MRSKLRDQEIKLLNGIAKHAKPVTDKASLELGRYVLITEFTGPQTRPKGFALALVDFGLIWETYGECVVRKILFKSTNSTISEGEFLKFAVKGTRVRLLSEDIAHLAVDTCKNDKVYKSMKGN